MSVAFIGMSLRARRSLKVLGENSALMQADMPPPEHNGNYSNGHESHANANNNTTKDAEAVDLSFHVSQGNRLCFI
jgi:hypothetical protein